jgi:8-oxo-dGTP pyrophosphatase MutT (NUDIX family)
MRKSHRDHTPILTTVPLKKKATNPWRTLATRRVYRNPWIEVTESQVLTPVKTPGIYGVVHFRNIAVGVVAIDREDRILLVGQYRYALNMYSWELPEGGSPKGSTTLATAKRELREETGYVARKWQKLLRMHLSNSVTDEEAIVYLAEDLRPGPSSPEETEDLSVAWIPFDEALRLVAEGKITDAISVAAIWATHARRLEKSASARKRDKKSDTHHGKKREHRR